MIFVVRDGLLHRKIIPSLAFPGLGVFLVQKSDHFIIGTFEVTIIKWQFVVKFLNFLLNKLKPAFFGNFEAIYLAPIEYTYFFYFFK